MVFCVFNYFVVGLSLCGVLGLNFVVVGAMSVCLVTLIMVASAL